MRRWTPRPKPGADGFFPRRQKAGQQSQQVRAAIFFFATGNVQTTPARLAFPLPPATNVILLNPKNPVMEVKVQLRVRNALCVRCRAGERPDAGAGQVSRLRRGRNGSGQRGNSQNSAATAVPVPPVAVARRRSATCRRPQRPVPFCPRHPKNPATNLPGFAATHLRASAWKIRYVCSTYCPEACRTGPGWMCRFMENSGWSSRPGRPGWLRGSCRAAVFLGGRFWRAQWIWVHVFRLAAARHLF